ncbi:TetR family transcriptional regulator [Plantactinospora sp. DSM 117369]
MPSAVRRTAARVRSGSRLLPWERARERWYQSVRCSAYLYRTDRFHPKSIPENLLRAARDCLLRNGYARTVRDLITASGANHASINYHFGSKDELLTQALHELNTEWGELLFTVIDAPLPPGAADVAAHEARWTRIIESIQTNRELWFVNFEGVSYLQHDEKIRATNARAQQAARTRAGPGVRRAGTAGSRGRGRVVGAHYYSLLVGVALQWLTDPEHAPTAAEIVQVDQRVTKRA